MRKSQFEENSALYAGSKFTYTKYKISTKPKKHRPMRN